MERGTSSTDTFRGLLLLGALLGVLSFPVLWGHSSDQAHVLGRFSTRYAAALGGFALLSAALLLLALVSRRVYALLQRIPWGLRGLAALGVLGLVAWGSSLPIEEHLWQVSFAYAVLLVALLLFPSEPRAATRRLFLLVWGGVVLLLLGPMLISNLTLQTFSPDEAQYADIGSSLFRAQGVYASTWLNEPRLIEPGQGWLLGVYGWLLTNVHFAIETGRWWGVLWDALAALGIGLAAGKLYGRSAGLLSALIAWLSLWLVPIVEFRPNHQLAAAGAFAIWLLMQGLSSQKRAWLWHGLVGLLVTVAMQIHAGAIVFAVGFSLFYLLLGVQRFWRGQRRQALELLLGFGMGAALGTLSYIVLNVLPVGGFQAYLDFLVGARWRELETRGIALLSLPTRPFEWLLGTTAWAVLLLRRSAADRRILLLLAIFAIVSPVVDTQGYFAVFLPLLFIPIGSALLSLRPAEGHISRYALLVASAALFLLVVQLHQTFIDYDGVRYVLAQRELPPRFYQELQPMLRAEVTEDDVVVGTTSLIWALPEHPQLLAFGAEITAARLRGYEDELARVWYDEQPTLVVRNENGLPVPPGLQQYMAENDFQVCQEWRLLGYAVELLRADCDDGTDADSQDE